MAALLDEVHATLGPNARVIAANRCRSGGVAGFFARESFEVTVEIPNAPAPVKSSAGRKRRRTGGSSEGMSVPTDEFGSGLTIDPNDSRSALEQLIDAADRADELAPAKAQKNLQSAGARASRPSAEAGSAPSRGTVSSRSSSGNVRRSRSQRDSAGSVSRPDARSEQDARSMPRQQTRTLDFAAVLDRAENEHATASVPVADTKLGRHADESERGGKGSQGSKSHKMFRRRNKPRPVEEPVDRIIDLSSFEGASVHESLAPRALPSRATSSQESSHEHAKPYIPRGDVPAGDLAALGVPAQWLTGAINGRVLIDSVLSRIPSPPPIVHAPGAILAFVGEGEMCLNTARAVAVALKQDPAACVFLSPGDRPAKACVHIKAIDELAVRRASWIQDDQVTVVAIDAGFARPDVAWGRHAISVLHPSLRWGVVSATRKVEDIFSWARGVGGLHALAVNGITDTASPASILAAGVPVARIDGQVASTDLWRKLLDDRLSEAATRRTPDLITT